MNIKAHVPVQQFGFIEIEGTPEEASEIERLYNHYAENPVNFKTGSSKKIDCFVGGSINYDEVAHVYTNDAGVVYQSGSQYGESFKKPFDGQAIANKMAEKIKANPADILAMWKLKGDASRDFGSAMHKALQLCQTYKELSEALGKEYHIHDNFVLKDIVESFYSTHSEEAVSEIFVVDHALQRVGQIDRLEILGEKHGRVVDFKSGEVTKNLDSYKKQLEFYTDIMTSGGWKMDKPVIYGWNGSWKEYK